MRDKNSEITIDFVGDITCDRPMLSAAKKENGKYYFDPSFERIKKILASADYVIGNLETVFAGAEIGYNPGIISYNSPDELCESLGRLTNQKLILTTANNHCLDCGREGVFRTLSLLRKHRIDSTGTHMKSGDTYFIKEINGIRLCVVSYSACMNQKENGLNHNKQELQLVNLLIGRSYYNYKKKCKNAIKFLLYCGNIKIKKENKIINPYKDDYKVSKTDTEKINNAIENLKKAKENSDCVVLCLHSGGQFNAEVGEYTEELIRKLLPYSDLIICNHPHVIQKIEIKGDKLVAYSLGGLNMSPSGDYISFENLPQYSLILRVQIKKEKNGCCKIKKVEPQILKTIEDESKYLAIYDTKELLKRYQGKELEKLKRDLNILHARIFSKTIKESKM